MWQGKGEGQLQLKVTYFPFELLYSKPRDASLVRLPTGHAHVSAVMYSCSHV